MTLNTVPGPAPVLLVDVQPRERGTGLREHIDGRASIRRYGAFASWLLIEADHVRVVLAGELDRPVLDDLDALLTDVDARKPTVLTADLARVTFVDVAATRLLLTWASAAIDRGADVMVRHSPRLLPTIAAVLGFPVHITVDR